MTTVAYDRRSKMIVADTQNTDSTGYIFRTNKIERLKNGNYFLGSGHCFTINQCRRWAEEDFAETSRPDFGVFLSDTDEYGFSCLVVSKDGKTVWLVDNEMTPTEIKDNYVAIGSGAAYAIGAMDAGANVMKAVEIACKRDGSTSKPISVVEIV